MKWLERIAGAAAVFVLSAATAAADCPTQSYTCDNDISTDLLACRNPFPWLIVVTASGNARLASVSPDGPRYFASCTLRQP